jgi:hypothetical protein
LNSAAIFVPYFTGEWLSSAENLRKRLALEGQLVRVLDVSFFSFPRRIDINPKLAKEICPFLESVPKPKLNQRNSRHLWDENELDAACRQSLKSLSRLEKPSRYSPILILTKRQMIRRADDLWQSLWDAEDEYRSLATAYIPNGRFPVDKVLTQFFQTIATKTKFWEMNASHSGYFVSEWEVHSWSKETELIEKYIQSNLDDQEKSDWARNWVAQRELSSVNPFSEYWNKEVAISIPESRKDKALAVFFSSSSDELGAIPEKELFQLHHQHSAVRILAQSFLSTNYRLIIRIHPNLLNKPLRQFVQEFRAYKSIEKSFGNVQVIPPWSATSSYELLKKADLVLVHGSTIGLEASALGKQVATTQRTAYSEAIGTIEILKPADIFKLYFDHPEVDPRKALIYIEYLHRYKVNSNTVRTLRLTTSHSRIVAGINILLASPLDALVALWFNYQWRTSKVLVNFLRMFLDLR